MNGTNFRIEVRDPDTRALPTLMSAREDDEALLGLYEVAKSADIGRSSRLSLATAEEAAITLAAHVLISSRRASGVRHDAP